MKTNKMMRIASVLLVAVLLTTCVISGTFAKYTTTKTATAEADIAKWSFNLDGADIATNNFTFDLFGTVTEFGGGAENEVTANKVAPGTQGEIELALENTSDVAVAYTITLALDTENNTVAPAIEYSIDGTTWKTIDQFAGANGELTMGDDTSVTVMWRWAFDADGNNDTAIGIAAAAGEAVYNVIATVTVAQIETLTPAG